jgi:hypothetical protein
MADRLQCSSCTVPLRPDQDWCVECGAAQPGRLGPRPGWRAAAAVVGATLALAGGASAASYAALTSDAVVEAAAPAPPGADPIVAQAPVVPQPPAETLPAPRVDPPETAAPDDEADDTPLDPVAPATPTTDDDADADLDTDTGTGAGDDAGTDDTDTDTDTNAETDPEPEVDPTPEVAELDLVPAEVVTYDAGARGGDAVTEPGDAVDGRRSTAWRAPVDPDGVAGIGLLITLPKARDVRAVELDALTPGFTVEVYTAKFPDVPADVLDPGWTRTDVATDVGTSERLRIARRARHVLLWITEQPADTEVGLSEVRLFGRD